MIEQTTNDKPKILIINNGKLYRYVKQCNPTLYLYENVEYGFKETFTNFQLGMVKEPSEKPHYKAHRINF